MGMYYRNYPPPLERFMTRVTIDDAGCWIWRTAGRYGLFWFEGANIHSHRWSYQRFVGEIPPGYEVDHLCLKTRCVNPAHLEAVTPQENMRRLFARITHCPSGHPYDEANTYRRLPNLRQCRACGRLRDQRRQKRAA